MIWFTADTHFGHKKIIEYSNRPFKSVEEMDYILIHNWNERVAPNDEVNHLGDFCFGNQEEYRQHLNGRIHLILGNHDRRRISLLEAGRLFETVQDVKYLRYNGLRFWLSHYAHRTWPKSGKGSFHLYGHSHGDIPDFHRSMDVGVDHQKYYPISIDEVVKKLEKFPITNHHRERNENISIS